MDFSSKLANAISKNQSLLVVALDPNPEMMPDQAEERNLMSSLWHWLKKIIDLTADCVCAYKPTLGFYQALGIPGLELLARVFEYIPSSLPIILDAKHGDLNTGTIFAEMIFENWQIDAVTLSSYPGQDHVAPFLVHPDKSVFILCRTSNPGAIALQEYPNINAPYYLEIVKQAQTWGTPEQVCLEVGSNQADVFRRIRELAPERTILARSIWSNDSNFPEIVRSGLNNNGEGLLIPVPNDWLAQASLAAEIQTLNRQVNQIRDEVKLTASSCQIWTSNVCLLEPNPHQDLILQLFDLGCILFGEYVQASGAIFPYYIDLRKIISNPQIFSQVITAYSEILQTLEFDRIAGIPYGSLPTATGLALHLNRPMIFPRKEVKAHGTRRVIEGYYEPGEKVVVVDDILITGKSVVEGAEKLKSGKLEIEDIVVFIDHEGGVKERLKSQGYNAYSVLNLSEITNTLYETGRINQEQFERFAQNH
ncbi:MAG: bifunctional orotidine-5'-phosphate decarboxylase/orotate phosphoribosyltransferase [Cyanobacteria bacterium J083]|nr:MAG: bifunctional orotidine-5'-phosphate decarboxylase/orotate phosphoribosyltransferase [Cyanobacteria bacterium J083]